MTDKLFTPSQGRAAKDWLLPVTLRRRMSADADTRPWTTSRTTGRSTSEPDIHWLQGPQEALPLRDDVLSTTAPAGGELVLSTHCGPSLRGIRRLNTVVRQNDAARTAAIGHTTHTRLAARACAFGRAGGGRRCKQLSTWITKRHAPLYFPSHRPRGPHWRFNEAVAGGLDLLGTSSL